MDKVKLFRSESCSEGYKFSCLGNIVIDRIGNIFPSLSTVYKLNSAFTPTKEDEENMIAEFLKFGSGGMTHIEVIGTDEDNLCILTPDAEKILLERDI